MRRILLAAVGWWVALSAGATGLSHIEALRLRAVKPGAVVQLPAFLKQLAVLPVLPVEIAADAGPQFLFSDKPEYFVTGDGIALQETVRPGVVRLYLYHVPTPSDERKTITAVIENLGDQPLTLRILRRGCPSPGKNYHAITKAAFAQCLNSRPAPTFRTLKPGSRAPLDPKLDATTAGRDDLVHAFYEFEINQPARVTVLQCDPARKSIEVLDTLPKLPQALPGEERGNGAGRGLFLTSNFVVTNAPGFVLETTNGAAQLIVADGKRDAWMRGHDSLGHTASTNVGNYGALYRIRLKYTSSDGRGWALLMSQTPGQSEWCGKLGAVVKVSGGVWPAGVITLPGDRVTFGGAEEAVLIQRFPPLPQGTSETIELVYSPPGACCLPTPLVFVPYEP
jgi:hypothetical protein